MNENNHFLDRFEVFFGSLKLQDDLINFIKSICEVPSLSFSMFQIVLIDWINIVEKFNDPIQYHSQLESSLPLKTYCSPNE